MVYSLRKALGEIMSNDKSYLHYYRRIIGDYEKGYWNFDIRNLVKKAYIDLPCSYHLSSKGYRKHFCFCVLDFDEFKYQFEKYLNEYLYPLQYLRTNKIIARKAWIKKYGYISKGNQYCQKAIYNCSNCINKKACEIAKKHTKNEPAMMKATKIIELLYGNLQKGHFTKLIED